MHQQRPGRPSSPRTGSIPDVHLTGPLAVLVPAGTDTPTPTPTGGPSSGDDPRFRTCGEANAAGYGPHYRGRDPECSWYQDRDGEGVVCER
ncbi:excalibur calcium-binding domain-containing protein [Nonomuraea rhodomycinica]|uniref:excalibur calcium-binding domain-containing protein n=1 Tax=Nonomuraea rhodomycinica TaxID=1712872 RepID=UPI001C37A64A